MKRVILESTSSSADENVQEQLCSNINKEGSENKCKRSKYSKLPENKKEEIRKKQREIYHAKKADAQAFKKVMTSENFADHSSKNLTSYAMLSEERKQEIRRKNREAYHIKKKAMIGNECISSFEIGSTSQQAFVKDNRIEKRKHTDFDSMGRGVNNKRLATLVPLVADMLPSPCCSPQVAAIWMQNDESADLRERDIKIYSYSGHSQKVKYYYGCYDPLQYPLLFPHGDTGWHEGIKKINRSKGGIFCKDDLTNITQRLISAEDLVQQEERVREKGRQRRNTVSCREYYSYKLQIRPDEKSILIHSRRLLQQYVVDIVALGENRGSKVGKRIVLPSSFVGGPRDMRRRYTDAMALVQRFGKPDIFLTMTCNPNWPEIKNELSPGEQPQDRPDVIARIFRAKIEQLKIWYFYILSAGWNFSFLDFA